MLSLLSPLTDTLPAPSASEVTTLRRYTNLFIIIIIIIIKTIDKSLLHFLILAISVLVQCPVSLLVFAVPLKTVYQLS